jgi:hypothetical protein
MGDVGLVEARHGRLRGLPSCPIGGARWLTDGLGAVRAEDGNAGSVPPLCRRCAVQLWVVTMDNLA